MLYFAYGSNLNIKQMLARCPGAQPLRTWLLPHYRLVFRCVADVVLERGSVVPGAIYRITAACEAALDRYEGYPRLYFKEHVHTVYGRVMFYRMHNRPFGPPVGPYLESIQQGYGDWGLDVKPLMDAVAESRRHLEADNLQQHVRRLMRGRAMVPVSEVAQAFKTTNKAIGDIMASTAMPFRIVKHNRRLYVEEVT